MILVQRREDNKWIDEKECSKKVKAQEYIKGQVLKGYRGEDYRIVMKLAHCETEVKFIDDIPLEEIKEPGKEKPELKPDITNKIYTDEELKLLYFERSCELGYWAKTNDFDAERNKDKYPSWFSFHYRLGSKSNVIDMIVHELKKEPVPEKYQEIIDKHYGPNHTGVYVIKKLADGGK